MLAHLFVKLTLQLSQLEHVAEHGHPPGAPIAPRARGELVEGGAHRHRVGVVAVVDQGHVPDQLHPLAAPRRQRQLDPARSPHPDRPRGGHRGEQVAAQVGLLEAHLELDALAADADLDPIGVAAEELDVSPVTECHRVQILAEVRREQGLAHRDDGGSAGRERGDQLRLGRGDRFDRPQQLKMHRSDADDHSHVRLGDGGELGDLSGAAHRHLEHQRLGAGRRGEDLERQPDLGVVVGPRRDRPAVRREHRQQQVLG